MDDDLAMPGADADFDQAVGDLRGVLKNDAEGTVPDFGGGDFGGGDFGADLDTDFPAIESQPAARRSVPDSDFGGSAGGGSFTMSNGGTARMSQPPGSALTSNLDLIMDIPIEVQIVLGNSRMQVSGLMNLEEGAIIALDKKIGEPVEIMVNGRRIARGEITVLENDDTRFGVKLIEVMSVKLP